MVSFKLIACVDREYGYSKNGEIPWHLDLKGNEMKHFKKKTTFGDKRNMLIMGYNTFNDMRNAPEDKCKKILETRDISVISKRKVDYNGIRHFTSILNFLYYIHDNYKNEEITVWACGGNDVWNAFVNMKIIDEIFISVIPNSYNCDKSLDKSIILKDFVLRETTQMEGFSVSNYVYKNKEEYKYLETIKKIMKKGYPSMDRSGVGTLSMFGKTFKYDIRNYRLPLFTHRKMFIRGIIEELLFFISGETNTKI